MTDLVQNLWFPLLFVIGAVTWIVLLLSGLSRRKRGPTVIEAPDDGQVLVVPHHDRPGDNQLNRNN
jgi:hypothetical protein